MEYQVIQIESKKDIAVCNTFSIEQYNWGGSYRPATYGKLGFIPHSGFFLKFICLEKNPKRFHTEPDSPVYQDSAVEAFFCFSSCHNSMAKKPYLNFEINANGTMLVKYGNERPCRESLPFSLRSELVCTAALSEDQWTIELLIPCAVVSFLYPDFKFQRGSHFTCNFYKIQESNDAFRHFASFSPIHTKVPNFHLPEFFADAVILASNSFLPYFLC